ncbi:hypothetical protein [uncultured Ornithinimicrobium sp.]|uniref:hypothetical protein n=1 Tax=uncultured Ornithinimicrobium sp. TaxID=259307 RepID=UPI002597A715|nr:hypothetical protein [uncultured Ornithinimicrobium sp.]
MDTMTSHPNSVNTRRLLLPYALTLIAAMTVIQAVVALTGGQITVLVAVLTALVAVGMMVWLTRNHRALNRVRFGRVIAHAIAFVTVTTSFNAHAMLRALVLGNGADGLQGVAHDLLATPWFGATLVMSSVWGVGLLIHLVGVILGRGWED